MHSNDRTNAKKNLSKVRSTGSGNADQNGPERHEGSYPGAPAPSDSMTEELSNMIITERTICKSKGKVRSTGSGNPDQSGPESHEGSYPGTPAQNITIVKPPSVPIADEEPMKSEFREDGPMGSGNADQGCLEDREGSYPDPPADPPKHLVTNREEKWVPPHDYLIKQPRTGNLCVLYALLNSFRTMEEVCQFLNVPLRDTILPEDTRFIIQFWKDKLNIDAEKNGLTANNVHDLLRNKEFQETVGIVGYVWKSTQMDLHHLLATKVVEDNQRYLCFGYQYPAEVRAQGVRNITQFMGRLGDGEAEEEEKETEDAGTIVGQKRKRTQKGKCAKKKPKSGMTAEEMRKPVSKTIREELEKGIMKHSLVKYKGPHTSHAALIYYNAYGVPFRYDPGTDDVPVVLPDDRDGVFTQGAMRRAVDVFCTSMLLLFKVYRVRIYLKRHTDCK